MKDVVQKRRASDLPVVVSDLSSIQPACVLFCSLT